MRAVVQRVREAAVTVDGRVVGRIGKGLLVLLGVGQSDAEGDAAYLLDKVLNLRIFEDEMGKMNRSLLDCGGAMLVISQFTLYGDARKGRRPSFVEAAPPAPGKVLYERFVALARARGIETAAGEFGAMMEVSLVNYGPVTILLDSAKLF
ncbi:MAG: D-tyrosyl-tRNA(Tyr) deacylase [Candidatus Tectomicrobia bacterium]|nr:D-tyrosyl-tRNA(Tyr) deacylase [Candidatus Tectomicrobia bacterium]